MIIADTSVMIEIADGSEKGKMLEECIKKAEDNLAITAFTVHEMLLPTSGKEKEMLERELSAYDILPFDYLSALESVKLNELLTKNGAMLSRIDLFIASICRLQGASLITLDSDFKRVPGLKLIIL